MNQKLLLPAIALVSLAVGLFGGAWLSSSSAPGGTPVLSLGGDAARRALADLQSKLARLEARIAELEGELAAKDKDLAEVAAARDKLAKRNEQMQGEVEKLNQEWTFSYGTTRDAGKFIGSLIKDGLDLRNFDRNDPDMATKMRDMFLKFASLGPILQEMQKIDDKPKEFAEFRASVLGEALGLDEQGRNRVAGIVERYKTQSLALPEDSEQRQELSRRALDEIRGGLPEEQQGLLDAIPGTRMGGMSDLLETPSLDPTKWRDRMRRMREPGQGPPAP